MLGDFAFGHGELDVGALYAGVDEEAVGSVLDLKVHVIAVAQADEVDE